MPTIVHYELPDWLGRHVHQREVGGLFTHDHKDPELSHLQHEESWYVETPPPA